MSEWPGIEFPDLELWLCEWLRAELPGVMVTNHHENARKYPLIIVRDESGSDRQFTARRRVSFRVVDADMAGAGVLARRLAALLRGVHLAGGPIVSCVNFGPHRTPATDKSSHEFYLASELVIVGSQMY